MQISKRSRWIMSFSVLSIFLLAFWGRVGVVRAIFDESHDAMVLYRVMTEILPSTPAGRYYLDLLMKHGSEIVEIVEARPERIEMFMHTAHLFVPGFEALLDGEGHTVYVSTDHVVSLNAELDWFVSMGSPALQEDIQKERQRLLMDQFVGMTMTEAWEYINSKWTPDMVVQPAATSIPVTPTPVPQVQPVLVKDQNIVPGSNGKWAYYLHNGVYLEYPASYHIYLGLSSIFFTSSIDPSNWYDPSSIMVDIWTLPVDEKDALTPDGLYPHASDNLVWQQTIPRGGFEGAEYILGAQVGDDVLLTLGSLLYNQENQRALHIQVRGIPLSTKDFALLNQEYEYFQHMVENIRMQTP
jgi:hypothetical protein